MASMTKSGLALALAATVCGCSFPGSDPRAEALAKKAFDQLRHNQLDALAAEISAEDWGPHPEVMLKRMHALLPAGDPQSTKMVGFNSYAETGGATLTLNIEYDYVDAQVMTSTSLAKNDKAADGWIIRGFHINIGGPANDTPSVNTPSVNPPSVVAPAPAPVSGKHRAVPVT